MRAPRAGLHPTAAVGFVAAAADAERDDLVARVLALVDGLDGPFPLPHVTSVWWCRRAR